MSNKPKVGDRLVTGYEVHKSLQVAVVLSVVEDGGHWVALVRFRGKRLRYDAVHEIACRVGLWRPWSERRADPTNGAAA